MGGKLGTILARAGHEVIFSYARNEQKLKTLARGAKGNATHGTPCEAALRQTPSCWPSTGRESTMF